MPEPTRRFDFLDLAKRLDCRSVSLKRTLRSYSKKDVHDNSNGDRHENGDVIYTSSLLARVFTVGKLIKVLRCECAICAETTHNTAPLDDQQLAAKICKRVGDQKLLVTLALIGGTFAIRQLHEHTCHNIKDTLNNMPTLPALRDKLFKRFSRHWEHCPHDGQHLNNREFSHLTCLEKQFLDQLQEVCWQVNVPSFQADNLLTQFVERQNLPFINQIPPKNCSQDSQRKFYEFKVHDNHCDDKLKGRLLFRKQLAAGSERAKKQIEREQGNLRYLKDVGHPNIAEVLFAFSEEQPPSFSLVFNSYPADLEQILYRKELNRPEFRHPNDPQNRYLGSLLDHWLWVGVLDVFDAVAVVHQPQNYIVTIPTSPTERFLGGHFDIKPANILINENGRFLLTDFGQSYFKKAKMDEEARFTLGAHTQIYIPPWSYSEPKKEGAQKLDSKRCWTQEYDLWGLACVCVEVLTYIVDGENGPTEFYRERSPGEDQVANFWERIDGHDRLKQCVQDRLSSYKTKRDNYLEKVASQIEKMFCIQKDKPLSVEACHQELSTYAKVDRYFLNGKNDKEIGGEGTLKCLNSMQTSFSTESVSHRCSLYLWANSVRDKTRLTFECSGSESQTIICPGTTNTSRDEFIPISAFDINTTNRLRANVSSFQCAFRTLHDGVIFHFVKRSEFNHFFGAITRQRILTSSELRLSGCKADLYSWCNSKTLETTDAHLQIWESLSPSEYDRHYTPPTIRTAMTNDELPAKSLELDRSSTTKSVGAWSKTSTTQDIVHFRLVLYLNTTSAYIILVVSLTYDALHEIFDDSKARMILERGNGEKKIPAVVYECKIAATNRPSDLDLLTPADKYPGIPLDPKILAENVDKGCGLKRIKIDFGDRKNMEKFRKCYTELFGNRGRVKTGKNGAG